MKIETSLQMLLTLESLKENMGNNFMLVNLKIRQNGKNFQEKKTTNFELRESRKTREFQNSACPKEI